ncbi:hypothetical protein D777_00941 [Marinobacter nitratireducens]|uniref:Uncharacterized protein n=1 Tax=Marinobacter nitratireducens TaxID=1137280 RepID=A0A072N4W4_9GAMM|nr:hypothetical protein D777_00941 [Marinobacter nitratireducens]
MLRLKKQLRFRLAKNKAPAQTGFDTGRRRFSLIALIITNQDRFLRSS